MAEMSAAAINDLPDSAFAYIEPGGSKDDGGRTVPRSLRHFPIHDAAHVRNALARAPQSPHGDKAMSKIHKAAMKFGVEVTDEETRSRAPAMFDRTYPLDDIVIRSGGDGRTVEAYAAVFDSPYEVRDQHGHYMEVIDRSAFNRTLAHNGPDRVAVLYNHGMTLHGTPSDMWSVPIGRALEIKPDGRGLYTVTRYNMSPEADRVLESIRNQEIRAQSFRGRVYRSTPRDVPRTRAGRPLPTVTRHELGLTDYGPTPIPVATGAEILAVRSVTDLVEEFELLDDEARAEVLRTLNLAPTPDGDPGDDEDTATSGDPEPGAEDPPQLARHSGRHIEVSREWMLRAWRQRGVSRGEAA